MSRALQAATMGVLLLSPVALGACSAGQVTQTATQERDKVGPSLDLGTVELRQVLLAYPREGRYGEGDDAELRAAIVNGGNEPETLIGIEGEGFDGVAVRGGTGTTAASGSAAGAGSGGTGTAGSGAAGAQAGEVSIEIPPRSVVYLGEDGPTVVLENLAEELTPAQSLELTMTFENAGEVTVPALVAGPSRAQPRDEAFDFHEQEGEEAGQDSNEVSGGGSGEDTSGSDTSGGGGGGHGG